jgi:hypothetical protein
MVVVVMIKRWWDGKMQLSRRRGREEREESRRLEQLPFVYREERRRVSKS